MKHSLLLSTGGLLLLLLIFFSSCDEITTTPETDSVGLKTLTISPNYIQFDNTTLIGDQTISINLTLTLFEPPGSNIKYTIERRDSLIAEGNFLHQSDTTRTAKFSISVNTADNLNLKVYVFTEDDTSGERIQGTITIRGRTVSPPIVDDAYNTAEVKIPDSGRERVDFFARVIHPENRQFIDRVNFFMIDHDGNQIGSNFQMYDDGVFNEIQGRIDEAAGDSLYSRAFFVDSGNNPAEIDVYYFAVGVDGQSSDTLQTQLSIVQ